MSRSKRHTLAIEIETDLTEGAHAAEDRLIRWLETFGHTSSSFGFRFFSLGRIAAKPLRGRIKKAPSHE